MSFDCCETEVFSLQTQSEKERCCRETLFVFQTHIPVVSVIFSVPYKASNQEMSHQGVDDIFRDERRVQCGENALPGVQPLNPSGRKEQVLDVWGGGDSVDPQNENP